MSGKKVEEEKHRSERIEETGQVTLDKNGKSHTIHLISVIGEVEGHDNLGTNSKTTKTQRCMVVRYSIHGLTVRCQWPDVYCFVRVICLILARSC